MLIRLNAWRQARSLDYHILRWYCHHVQCMELSDALMISFMVPPYLLTDIRCCKLQCVVIITPDYCNSFCNSEIAANEMLLKCVDYYEAKIVSPYL